MAYGAAGIVISGSPPSCRVFNSAAIGTTTAVQAFLTFDSERFDTDNMHSLVLNPGRITFNTPGVYVVTGNLAWSANATGQRTCQIRLNGATYLAAQDVMANTVGGNGTAMSITTTYKFAANDYVELGVFQTSGGSLNVLQVGNYTPEFSAMWVGLGT